MTGQNFEGKTMKRIRLLRGEYTKVSTCDFKKLSEKSWYLSSWGRAVRKEGHRTIYMSREIIGCSGKVHVDHKNGDKLDNRRRNLRIASVSQNQMNRTKSDNKSSRFKGVCWDKSRLKWIVHLKKNKKVLHLGRFAKEVEAAKAYNVAAEKHFGKFAKLNNL